MTETAAYTRVSTQLQEAQRQREELDMNFDVDRWYGPDRESGATLDRESFQMMLEDLDEIDRIVVHESSRLTRDLGDMVDLLEQFEDHGVRLETLGVLPDFNPDEPLSRAFVQIISAVQEMEREQIRARVRSGVEQAKREGKWTGRTPFGYMTNENGYLVKDDVQWGVLRDALDALREGRSQNEVAEEMNINQPTLSRVIEKIEEGHEHYEELEFDREEWRLAKISGNSDNRQS